MKKYNKTILFLSAILLLTACNTGTTTPETSGHDEEEKEQHEEDRVSLSENQIDAIGIKTGPLTKHYLGAAVKANGRLEVPPQNEAKVSAYAAGNVREILVIEGDKVQKGQTLAFLEHPDLITIQQDYQEALNRLDYLEKEYARKKRLFDEEIGSGREFQQVESEYRSMQSRAAALKVKLTILHLDPSSVAAGRIYEAIPVKTPIGGYVKMVNVVTGQHMQPQQELFEIVDNSHIHADLMVYERDIAKVKKGQTVLFTMTSMPERELTATIYSVGKAFEEDPKAVHVHAEIENGKDDLIPGIYVQGRIITDQSTILALPEGGVVTEGDRSYIFVLTAEDHAEDQVFQMIEVGTGITEAGLIAIKPLSGLPDSVSVVTQGAYYLLAEMNKGESEHSH